MNKVVITKNPKRKDIELNGMELQGVNYFALNGSKEPDKPPRLLLDLEVSEFQITCDNDAVENLESEG